MAQASDSSEYYIFLCFTHVQHRASDATVQGVRLRNTVQMIQPHRPVKRANAKRGETEVRQICVR